MAPQELPGPLHGLRVLELAGIGPVPFAGMMLAQMGAVVTRVERPAGLESPIPPGQDMTNAGKHSRTIDMRRPSGVAELTDLAADADVLIEGHRPGVLEKLGVGPDVLLTRNPALIVGRVTGWGQAGPLASTAGHDLNYIAITGALHAIGDPDGPPRIPLNLIGDYGGGALYLVCGVLAALHERSRTGHGQVIDAAIVDGTAHLLTGVHSAMAAGLWTDRRGVNFADGGAPWYSVYKTADDAYMAVTAAEDMFYAELLSVLGLEHIGSDRSPGRWPEIRAALATAFARRTQREWTELTDSGDACVAPVLSLRAAAAHPHLAARQTLTEVDGRIVAAPAPRFSGSARPAIGMR
jgi:alpha-methylacyl-CoA racemase